MIRFNKEVTACRACPRLVAWREQVAREKRRAFRECDYWGRPVPNFGDPEADRLIVGLAPAAHGANRTGRMFTGDRSGDWLYRALHKAGVASIPTSNSATDGLNLTGVLITAVVHCAPPDNKPLPSEFSNCRAFLLDTLAMRQWKAILCLGAIAWINILRVLGEKPRPFFHGRVERSTVDTKLVASYHPSQQNTFTGRLTESMLDAAVREFLS
ncbi:MAG: uracil-DNA glycosylase [Fimbriimonadales bacterium]